LSLTNCTSTSPTIFEPESQTATRTISSSWNEKPAVAGFGSRSDVLWSPSKTDNGYYQQLRVITHHLLLGDSEMCGRYKRLFSTKKWSSTVAVPESEPIPAGFSLLGSGMEYGNSVTSSGTLVPFQAFSRLA